MLLRVLPAILFCCGYLLRASIAYVFIEQAIDLQRGGASPVDKGPLPLHGSHILPSDTASEPPGSFQPFMSALSTSSVERHLRSSGLRYQLLKSAQFDHGLLHEFALSLAKRGPYNLPASIPEAIFSPKIA
ncbi:hypothetical protein B0H11DRAFT_2223403 [Mycena galericulata]|nr:hypothetical protein B0H11DRAFT_2223403 [Mycena galericulata]